MLYALAHPTALLLLLSSYVIGMTAHGWVQSVVADRLGDRRPRAEGRLKADPRHHLDAFGAVAAALSGLGWARPVELAHRRQRGTVLLVALSGPAINLLLGLALLVSWRVVYGPAHVAGLAYDLQRGVAISAGDLGYAALLLVGASQLYLGVLSLVPLPPLDGGRLLFALGPQTLGWQKARYHLVEQNIGIAVLLALLLVPLGGPLPLLPQLLDTLLEPVLNLVCGG